MIRPVVFRPAAQQDLLDAYAWYEERQAGLGDRLVGAVETTLGVIRRAPERCPLVHRDVRRALVRPFPYGVYYRVLDQTVHVIAVMHGRRDPERWRSRADTN